MELLVNDRPTTIASDATVKDLLNHLNVTVKHVAVEVNGALVPRAQHESVRLQDGDRVEVVTLVGGG